jgi:TorA maturation chaperone TorD
MIETEASAPVEDDRGRVTLIDLAEARYTVYRILAQVFLFPSPERLTGLRNVAGEFCSQSTLSRFAFYTVWRDLLERLASLNESDAGSLRIQYASAFRAQSLAPGGGPLESRFLVAGNGTCTQVDIDLSRRYSNVDMSVDPDACVPADHISVQLEYLAVLVDLEFQGREQGDIPASMRALRLQRAFLRQHLDWWLPTLRDQVAAAAPDSMYHLAACASARFIPHERDLINLLIDLNSGAYSPAEQDQL